MTTALAILINEASLNRIQEQLDRAQAGCHVRRMQATKVLWAAASASSRWPNAEIGTVVRYDPWRVASAYSKKGRAFGTRAFMQLTEDGWVLETVDRGSVRTTKVSANADLTKLGS